MSGILSPQQFAGLPETDPRKKPKPPAPRPVVTAGPLRPVGVPASEISRLATTGSLAQRIEGNWRATHAALLSPEDFDRDVMPLVQKAQAPGFASTALNVAASHLATPFANAAAESGADAAVERYLEGGGEIDDRKANILGLAGATGAVAGTASVARLPGAGKLRGSVMSRVKRRAAEGAVQGGTAGAVGGAVLGDEHGGPGLSAAARQALLGAGSAAAVGGAMEGLPTAARAAGGAVSAAQRALREAGDFVGPSKGPRASVASEMFERQPPDMKAAIARDLDDNVRKLFPQTRDVPHPMADMERGAKPRHWTAKDADAALPAMRENGWRDELLPDGSLNLKLDPRRQRAGFLNLRPSAPPKPAYLASPAVQQVRASVASGTRNAAPRTPTGERAHQLYTRLVDETAPLKRFGRDVGGSKDLSNTIVRGLGWQGAASARLQQELRPVLQLAKGHEDGVMALAKSQRALALSAQGLDKTGLPDATHQATIQQLSAVPEVAKATNALQNYYRSLLEYKAANGVISPQQYQTIVQSGDFYTPFVRDFGLDPHVPSAGGGKWVNRGTGVRKMDQGTARAQTVDPFEQAILDTFETERTVAKQRVTNVVSGIVQNDPQSALPFLRRVPSRDAVKHGRVVEANLNGQRAVYEVTDPELFEAWAAFDPKTQGVVVKTLAPFKRVLQAGVTILPDFAAANAIRDSFMTGAQYSVPLRSAASGGALGALAGAATADEGDRLRGGAIGAGIGLGAGANAPNVARILSAMRDVLGPKIGGNRQLYDDFLKAGGGGFGFYAKTPADARKALVELRRSGVSPSDIVNPKRWWESLRAIGEFIENAPRFARHKATLAQGGSMTEGVAAARDVSLNFAQIGKDTKGIAATTAFWNAKVQGWDKLARLMKDPKTWAVGAATMTAPTIALWSINKDNPEYWERPQWERNLFWLVPKANGGFVRLPKPFEVGFVFASLPERILDYAHERDPETLAFALGDMFKTTGEGTFPVPTALEPVIENATNYDFFRNRPVVNRPDLPKEMQTDDRTSSAAVGLGKVSGQSPQQIDNLLGLTGSLGREVLDVVDMAARKTGLDKRPLPPDNKAPFVSRFVTRAGVSSDAEQAVRRRYAAVERIYRGANALLSRGDDAGAERYVRKNQTALAERDALKAAVETLETIREATQIVERDNTLSPDQKRALLSRLRAKGQEIASGATGRQVAVAARPQGKSVAPVGNTPGHRTSLSATYPR